MIAALSDRALERFDSRAEPQPSRLRGFAALLAGLAHDLQSLLTEDDIEQARATRQARSTAG